MQQTPFEKTLGQRSERPVAPEPRERLPLPDAAREQAVEQSQESHDTPGRAGQPTGESRLPQAAPAAIPAGLPVSSPDLQVIEKILEQDLRELYQKMQPDEQLKFKQRGELAAKKIEQKLRHAKVRLQDIIAIILDWLKTIPGVNKFFIEQEAKIKAEKIIKLKQ